jgi:hypothetical protein
MNHRLKIPVMALTVVLIVLVSASAAQAEFLTFRTDPPGHNAILTAESDPAGGGTQVFGFAPGVAAECAEVEFKETTVGDKSTELTARLHYNKDEKTCSLGGLGKAKVATNGCVHTFTFHLSILGFTLLHLGCGAGSAIEVAGPLGCTIKIPEQTVSGVRYKNVETGAGTTERHITLEQAVTGTQFTSTAACALAGIPAKGTEGTVTGNITVTGFEDNEGGAEGSQIGIYTETLSTETMP